MKRISIIAFSVIYDQINSIVVGLILVATNSEVLGKKFVGARVISWILVNVKSGKIKLDP
ncbi:hypothetical protein GCM10009433_04070 [Psychroflexus lacisalsi]|uniref:Uncharacterized protein n=1 Tax=Psychroflexus lacisalsi TaxID=503928 RepID=A0ABP3VED5_9FLAO